MVGEAKLEPGWLTRDVNDAASRAKSLEAGAAARENVPQQPTSPQAQQRVDAQPPKE